MISAEEIRNKHFSKAGMSGYKKIEVETHEGMDFGQKTLCFAVFIIRGTVQR